VCIKALTTPLKELIPNWVVVAVLDQRIIWYGSINLLSIGIAEESIMRLESPNIAHELMKSLSLSNL
jgi:hypothetical protein